MITLIRRKYKCEACGHMGQYVNVIKDNKDVLSEFIDNNVEDIKQVKKDIESGDNKLLYSYQIIREDSDLPSTRKAIRLHCEKCNSKKIERVFEMEYKNVSNFFPKGEAEKWYEGMNK